MTEDQWPERVKQLPRFGRYPVPYFALMVDGVPDFRVVDTQKKSTAAIRKLCWICGQKISHPDRFCFVGGPSCTRNGLFGDGPSHFECAEFAMQICPYIMRDDATRADFQKIMAKLGNYTVVDESSHIEKRPDWFYLVQAADYRFMFVPEVGHRVFVVVPYKPKPSKIYTVVDDIGRLPRIYVQIDQWQNGKKVRENIDIVDVK